MKKQRKKLSALTMILALLVLVLTLVLVLVLLPKGTTSPAHAEKTAEEENDSQFERVQLKKGSLIVKEVIDYDQFKKDDFFDYSHESMSFGITNTLEFQTASILDVETGIKVYALRIVTGYYESEYDYGEIVGVMDADEIDGAIQTLQYIKQNISNLKDYSEIVYKTRGDVEIGAYYSTPSMVYVRIKSKVIKVYEKGDIDELISVLKRGEELISKKGD